LNINIFEIVKEIRKFGNYFSNYFYGKNVRNKRERMKKALNL